MGEGKLALGKLLLVSLSAPPRMRTALSLLPPSGVKTGNRMM